MVASKRKPVYLLASPSVLCQEMLGFCMFVMYTSSMYKQILQNTAGGQSWRKSFHSQVLAMPSLELQNRVGPAKPL